MEANKSIKHETLLINDIDNQTLKDLKSTFVNVTLKQDYIDKRRALNDRFILFFLYDSKSFSNSNTALLEESEEWAETVLSLNKKFNSKADIYCIDFTQAEDSLISALVENFDENEKEKIRTTKLPVFALAHPHIPDIEILSSVKSPFNLYNAMETNFKYYNEKFEIEKQETLERAEKLVNSFPVVVIIKGTPMKPYCKFSKTFMNIVKQLRIDYRGFDIFEDDKLRGHMKFLHGFRTFPQFFVNGKLIGGLDVIKDLDEKGELIKLIPEECLFKNTIDKVEKIIKDNEAVIFAKVSNLLYILFIFLLYIKLGYS